MLEGVAADCLAKALTATQRQLSGEDAEASAAKATTAQPAIKKRPGKQEFR